MTTIKLSELRKYLNELRRDKYSEGYPEGHKEWDQGYDACIEAIEGKFLE
jgi:hypothetical protein